MKEDKIQAINKDIDNHIVQKDSSSSFIEWAKKLNIEPVFESKCKLCNNKFREESEKMYMDGKNCKQIHQFLVGNGYDGTSRSVQYHFERHVNRPIINQKIKYHAENLHEYLQIMDGEEQRLRNYQAILDRRIHMLSTQFEELGTKEAANLDSTISSLMDQAIKLQDQINKKNESIAPARIVIEKLQMVIMDATQNTNSEEVKQALVHVLTELQEKVGGEMTNG